jgi:hypothetical protein
VPKKRLSKSSFLWFIRSRSYVSVPDIRRRFNLDGSEDVTPVAAPQGQVYVGLPAEAARVLGDLVREGRVGLELQPGLAARAAIGVFIIPQAHDHWLAARSFPGPSDAPEEKGDEPIVASGG